MSVVTVPAAGGTQSIPLSQLALPHGFNDQDLKVAVIAHLKAAPSEYADHHVVREGENFVLNDRTEWSDALVVRFLVWGVSFLFVGTIQGVVQVMPDIRRWIFSTGGAGHLIDPLAHAHVNLVGGVVMVIIAVCYYLLPRTLKRPLYSKKLAHLSLWGMAAGVSMWYTCMVTLGYLEGTMMLEQGVGFHDAKAAFQPWHALGFVVPASVMGVGHWLFILNVYLTVIKKNPTA